VTIRWSYALNQWKQGHDLFVRREQHEKAFKTVSISGFEGIELQAGTGRWEPLGRKDWIQKFYGSVGGFRDALEACGVMAVSSFLFNPGEMILEELAFGRSVLNPADHSGILQSMVQYAELLNELDGDTLVARALPTWSADCATTKSTMALAAQCWNAVGQMAADHGLRLALNFDCITMARSGADIGLLLEHCDPALVGLSIDTADAAITGIDPVALYDEFRDRVFHIQLKNTRHRDDLGEYRLAHPERAMLVAGGEREIERWYWELGDHKGLVDVEGFFGRLVATDYSGWVVVESDQSPDPPASTMLNGWFVQNRLMPKASRPAGSARSEQADG
jgi:inosose dehydratase